MASRWPMASLWEVATQVRRAETPQAGVSYRQIGVRLWGAGAYEREPIDGANTNYGEFWRVEEGDIVVNKIWARNGSVGVVSSELAGCYGSTEFPTFAPDRERLEPRWFHWITKARFFWRQCDEKSQGTSGKNRIRPERFLEIEIPLPPLPEQRRIVARIEELAGKVEAARALRAQAVTDAEALWASALARAFAPGQGLYGDDGESASELLALQARAHASLANPRYNRAHPGNPSVGLKGWCDLPALWVWTDLGSVLTHLVDCVNDTPDFFDAPTGLLGLKSTNIRPYGLDLGQTWHMSESDFEQWNRREPPQPGDIILTREAPMGYACILPAGLRVCLTQRLMLLRTDHSFVQTRYVLHFLNSPYFRKQVLDVCRGITTPHIRVEDAPRITLPLGPLRHQLRIVAYLDDLQAKLDAVKAQQAAVAAQLDALLPAILDRAFRGEL